MDNEMVKADEKTTAIQQVHHEPIPADAPLMIRVAMMMERGIKIDTAVLSEMQKMAEQFESNEARKAYASDFAAAQASIGAVVKTRKNNQTNSMYAGLDDVIEMSKTACAKHDFSVTFSEGETSLEKHIRLIATVLHRDGHEKMYHYDIPIGGVGIKGVVNMTAIHAKATSVSYGQRYLLCLIWNIPTKDTDGNPPPAPPKPKVRATTTTELEVIDAICEKLPPAGAGFVLNKGHIQAILIEKARDFLVFEQVDHCVTQLMEKYGNELHEPANSVPADENEIPAEFTERE